MLYCRRLDLSLHMGLPQLLPFRPVRKECCGLCNTYGPGTGDPEMPTATGQGQAGYIGGSTHNWPITEITELTFWGPESITPLFLPYLTSCVPLRCPQYGAYLRHKRLTSPQFFSDRESSVSSPRKPSLHLTRIGGTGEIAEQ